MGFPPHLRFWGDSPLLVSARERKDGDPVCFNSSVTQYQITEKAYRLTQTFAWTSDIVNIQI